METPVSATSVRANGPSVQRRAFALDGAEIRSVADGSGGEALTFTGYACVTNRSYEMNDMAGSYPETVRAGAFKDTLGKKPDVPFLLNHDGLTLARTKSGTLKLAEDSTGLHAEARLDPSNSVVRDIKSAMERGDVDEMSFAFRILDPDSGWNEDFTERSIGSVDINKGDVSVVNYGASPHTAGASIRSVDRFFESLTADERAELLARLTRNAAAPVAAVVPAAPVKELKALGVTVQDLQTYTARAYVLRNAL